MKVTECPSRLRQEARRTYKSSPFLTAELGGGVGSHGSDAHVPDRFGIDALVGYRGHTRLTPLLTLSRAERRREGVRRQCPRPPVDSYRRSDRGHWRQTPAHPASWRESIKLRGIRCRGNFP